jgi:hypothetical protein
MAGGNVLSGRRDFHKSGRVQPHSKTSRTEWRARERASVLECGCTLLLYFDMTLAKVLVAAVPEVSDG